jgi:nucleoside-diphosphate-sugar epimerase
MARMQQQLHPKPQPNCKPWKPVINGDGMFSRDFTYIDNVAQVLYWKALLTENPLAINTVYNTAFEIETYLKWIKY